MNITLTLDDRLVKEVRKIAAERETTLTGLVRAYLEKLAEEESAEKTRKAIERFEESFQKVQFSFGDRTWTRADLHDRKQK